jgi:hypothetical protein
MEEGAGRDCCMHADSALLALLYPDTPPVLCLSTLQGNSTQVGPVLLPLLPSSARAAQSPQAQANNGQASDSQDGQESISPFSPPLPWLANMEFSDRIALSDILPLTSNASLNTSGSNASASAGPINYGAYNNNGGSSSQGAQQANMGVPLNASGNLVGAQPFSYVNVTDLDRQLSQVGLVTVMTVFLPDGTTITSFNITNTTDNATTNNATTNSAGNQGKRMHLDASSGWWLAVFLMSLPNME